LPQFFALSNARDTGTIGNEYATGSATRVFIGAYLWRFKYPSTARRNNSAIGAPVLCDNFLSCSSNSSGSQTVVRFFMRKQYDVCQRMSIESRIPLADKSSALEPKMQSCNIETRSPKLASISGCAIRFAPPPPPTHTRWPRYEGRGRGRGRGKTTPPLRPREYTQKDFSRISTLARSSVAQKRFIL